MIPLFKYYFYPFLSNLKERGSCRLYDLGNFIAQDLKMNQNDKVELTKGGKITKHQSRLNYCASYLKKMKLVETFSSGSYSITKRGEEVLEEFGNKLTLDDLRNLPEFLSTQISATNDDYVYVRAHTRGGKIINPYIANKKNLKKKNPNIEADVSEQFRKNLKSK